jgi:hypothetical protein
VIGRAVIVDPWSVVAGRDAAERRGSITQERMSEPTATT